MQEWKMYLSKWSNQKNIDSKQEQNFGKKIRKFQRNDHNKIKDFITNCNSPEVGDIPAQIW